MTSLKRKVFPRILFILLLTQLVFSCKSDDYDQFKTENEQLQEQVESLESRLLKVGMGTRVLNFNLDSITRIEDQIRAELEKDRQENDSVLVSKVKKLATMVAINRTVIEALKDEMGSQNVSSKLMLDMILKLDDRVKAKEYEIAKLNQSLAHVGDELRALIGNYADLQAKYDERGRGINEFQTKVKSLEQALSDKNETLAKTEESLYLAYYSFGSRKELLKLRLLEKSGMSKTQMNADFNRESLNEVDIRNFKELVIPAYKALVISEHPSSSYTLEDDNGYATILRIKDYESFWSYSKLLIIQTGK